jgi:hypothetical protein
MLSAAYQYEYLDFVPVGQFDWRTHDADVTLSHSITPKAALVAGYAYHVRDFEGERLPLQPAGHQLRRELQRHAAVLAPDHAHVHDGLDRPVTRQRAGAHRDRQHVLSA